MSEIKQLNPEEYSVDRKLAEEEKKRIAERKITEAIPAIPIANKVKTKRVRKEVNYGMEHPNKQIRYNNIYIKCVKCGEFKLCTNLYWKRVEVAGSEQKLLETYQCKLCRKEVKNE